MVCDDQRIELFAAWKTPEENAAEGTRVPILMYHQFTSNPDGETGWLRGNYAYIGDFDAQMNHIATTGFYLPTWDELSAFIDGRLFLPSRSVIITDDDADQSWFDLAVPVIDKYRLLSTSFMITAYRTDPPHRSTCCGARTPTTCTRRGERQGRMVNWTADQIAADLNASGDVLGVREVMAYPSDTTTTRRSRAWRRPASRWRGRSSPGTCRSVRTSSRFPWCASTTAWGSTP